MHREECEGRENPGIQMNIDRDVDSAAGHEQSALERAHNGIMSHFYK